MMLFSVIPCEEIYYKYSKEAPQYFGYFHCKNDEIQG
jgi:hypothetical protein